MGDGAVSVSAIVLAGGRSLRMGRPKATLPFGGRPLVASVVEHLRQRFDDVVVVAAPGQVLPPLQAAVIFDRIAYQGPASGIREGLLAVSGGAAFVAACDGAFLEMSLVEHLVSRLAGHDVVVPFWDGRCQPVHAVYRKSVLPALTELLETGERRPAALFGRVRTCRVEADEIRRFDRDGASFWNINTPEDYAAALARGRRSGLTVEGAARRSA